MKLLLTMSVLAGIASCVFADSTPDDNVGSLWPGKDYRNPFTDRTARKAGDIITIIISESSTATFSAK